MKELCKQIIQNKLWNSAYIHKRIISAFKKPLQVKLALSLAKWIALPLNEDITVIECFILPAES